MEGDLKTYLAGVPLPFLLATCSRARKGRKLAESIKFKVSIKSTLKGFICCAVVAVSRYDPKRGEKLYDPGQEALPVLANFEERKLGAEALAAATLEVSVKGEVR